MSDLDDSQQARLFDALLSDADRWNMAPSAQARRAAETDATVADDLALVAALRELAPSHSETETARARVALRLAEVMRAEPARAASGRLRGARAWLRAVTAPPARVARNFATPLLACEPSPARGATGGRRGRAVALGAIALIVIAMLMGGATVVSAQSLPESPLYTIKRAEEALQLDFAMTDNAKGAALATIANHRLAEAIAEADQRHDAEASTLLQQFSATLSQMIDLTAHAQSMHENTIFLASAMQTLLLAAENSAARASAHGERAFASAATASIREAHAHLLAAGVTLPATPAQNGAGSSGQGAGGGGNSGNTTGKGNGKGNGKDKGSSSGNSVSGQPTVEPKSTHTPRSGTPGASASVTPTATP